MLVVLYLKVDVFVVGLGGARRGVAAGIFGESQLQRPTEMPCEAPLSCSCLVHAPRSGLQVAHRDAKRGGYTPPPLKPVVQISLSMFISTVTSVTPVTAVGVADHLRQTAKKESNGTSE
ncbi:MAG TPA: hypothetical protein VLZ05_11190 [Mycobacterium sp.]|nr:hypothetical protein [Mycobacterium sp.]HUH69387.1 hypothetical protein [Mycobacterium sp.]